ncbi:type II toxin-antitoxin system HicB family antitoxin, partial [Lachnospira multipara]|uniref:Predicted nuclease of the RNAse H fold, HicB family n=1 Tax=Lachnospira multipara TaxID=28051 RepID=A0A1H5SVY8_9FIRM
MKSVDYYNDLPYKVRIIPNKTKDTFTVAYPELPEVISEGKTIEEALNKAKKAKYEWLSLAVKNGTKIVEPD